MKKLLILSLIFFYHAVYAQTIPGAGSMTLELKNDTLFSNTGLKFFVGQKLSIGNAAGENAYYRSVIYKNAAIVPSIWGQDTRYDNAIENHVNKKKSREKVKSTLLPGNFVTIKKNSVFGKTVSLIFI